MKTAVAERAGAASAVNLVVTKNRTIDWVEGNRPELLKSPLQRQMVYGCLRHFFSLQAAVDQCLDKSLKSKDQIIYHLMLVGAYQLMYLRVQDHAVVNETVAACAPLQRPWAKRLVNAVLRSLIRKRADYTEQTFDHSEWFVDNIKQAYPQSYQDVLLACNQRAPMCLRINLTRTSLPAYQALLQDAGIAAQPGLSAESLILDTPQSSASLPGWADGLVSVQDQAPQFAAHLLLDQVADTHKTAPIRLLDACAAPGGKLFHSMELAQHCGLKLHSTALEKSRQRLSATQAIAQRLGHDLPGQVADATQLQWWDNTPFQLISLDAPCSATGTMRRHPDIKLLLQPPDIARHAALQLQLLHNLWQVLASGGTLLYSTCSLLREENDAVVAAFLHAINGQTTAAVVLPVALPTGQATEHGWQCLPTDARTDGFYYALLRKTDNQVDRA